MSLIGKVVYLHLSQEGVEYLAGIADGGIIVGLVLEDTFQGLWMLTDDTATARLIKWQYLSLAEVDWEFATNDEPFVAKQIKGFSQ